VSEGVDVEYAPTEKPGHKLSDGVVATHWSYYGPGLDLFTAETGPFAFYEENDQVWIKLKYSLPVV
jgi:hypothetical protein